ncbi:MULTISPECIES: calcium-binding protein [unclassified Microcoleus]|uniref:calcium-binding protein n=1 Tax=unclassified Microcoleus TaxID=2642155 RepID=UPI002FD5226A
MALQPDPSESRQLLGDTTSEFVTLSIADATNFPLGVWMLAGDDFVTGSTANDLVYGNEGEDIISGDLGNDSLFGGKGKDFLIGDEGNDSLSGGQDADFLIGGAGNDILLGGRGNDFLVSGNGNDTLVGGLGRDILGALDDNNSSIKIGGSNLYVVQAEAGVTDVNNADFIVGFRVGADRIGLAGGLNASDLDLQYVTNVTVLFGYDAPESAKLFTPPGSFDTQPIQSQGTLIKVRNSGDIVGFVSNVRVTDLQGSIISAPGF